MRDDSIRLTPAQLAAFALAIIGAWGYTAVETRPESVRPDPFTGSDGRMLRHELQLQLDELRRQQETLRRQLEDCIGIIDRKS